MQLPSKTRLIRFAPAFADSSRDDYHEGPLGGWGPGAGWDPEIPERDMPSATSRASKQKSSASAPNNDASSKVVNNVFSIMALDDESSTMALDNRSSTNALSRESPSKSSFQTTTPTTSRHHELIDLTSESEEVPHAGKKYRMVDSTQSSRSDSSHHSGAPQGTTEPIYHTYPNARAGSLAMVAPTFRAITPPTSSLDTPAPATVPSDAAAASPFSHTAVASSAGGGSASATMGLTLVVGGVTYPRIEDGKERWYTQRPGRNNNYSRYSDLAKFDTSKGVRVAPKASRAQLGAARRYRTFG